MVAVKRKGLQSAQIHGGSNELKHMFIRLYSLFLFMHVADTPLHPANFKCSGNFFSKNNIHSESKTNVQQHKYRHK